jgi:hypothetical protein
MKHNFVSSVFFGLWLLGLCVIAWSSNKGFDLTDEGLYIMDLTQPKESSVLYQFHHFFHFVFSDFSLEVIGYRIVRLVLTVLSTFVLSYGIYRWINANSVLKAFFTFNFIVIFSLIGLGSFLSYSIFPQTLSYNNFSVILLQFISGIILLISSVNSDKSRFYLVFILGLFLSMLLFTKITSAIMFFAVISIYLFIFFYPRYFLFVKSMLFLFLGVLFAYLTLHFIIDFEYHWLPTLFNFLSNYEGHAIGDLLVLYKDSMITALSNSLINHFEVPLLFFTLLIANSHYKMQTSFIKRIVFITLFLFILSYFGYLIWAAEYYKSGASHMITAIEVFILFLFCLFAIVIGIKPVFKDSSSKDIFQIIAVLALFFMLPFIGGLGTNNPMSIQILQYLFSWMVIFLVLIGIIHHYNSKIGISMMMLIAFVSLSQSIHGLVYKPYRIQGTLVEQTEKIKLLSHLNQLQFHPQTKNYIETIYTILKTKTNYEHNRLLISTSGNPGLTYVLNGVSPGKSWYKYEHPQTNCFSFLNSKKTNLTETIFLVNGTHKPPNEFVSCLNQKGLNFPSNYIYLDKVNHPFFDTFTTILVPKNMIKL